MNKIKIIQFVICRCERWNWRFKEDKPFEATSMGDIAFLLLIFFIITSSFIVKQGVFFQLPSQTGSVKVEQEKIIDVYPRNNGFFYNNKLYDRETMKKFVIEQKKIMPDKVLVIHMDYKVKYDRLVDTLSIAKETGIKRISLKNVNGNSK